MNFCEKCQNMLYIKIASEDSASLIHYCRNCGHQDPLTLTWIPASIQEISCPNVYLS